MKKLIFILVALLIFGSIACAGEFIPYGAVPSCLRDVYEYGLYKTHITSYTRDIGDAPVVIVQKVFWHPLADRQCYEYSTDFPFLGYDRLKFDAFLKSLVPYEKGVLSGGYDYSRYRVTGCVEGFLATQRDYDLVVIKSREAIIGCWPEPALHEVNYGRPVIKRLTDGRYMAANEHAVRYISVKRGTMVIEHYFGAMGFHMGSFNVGPGGRRGLPEITILTDNVIRKAYKNGNVEHWKVRLTQEDFDKNTEKWRAYYEEHKRTLFPDAGDKHLLWRNYTPKPSGVPASDIQPGKEMWCFREGGEEPSAEAYADMGFEDTLGVPNRVPPSESGLSPATETAGPKAGASEAAPGFFARLIAVVKGLFAGLFAA